MNNIIPIFKSDGSIGKSILTIERKSHIKDHKSVAITDICTKYDLKQCIVLDDSPINFVSGLMAMRETNTNLIFGTNFTVLDDAEKQDEESLKRESKIAISFKNDQGYLDWVKIWNTFATNKKSFYYIPRIEWAKVFEMWTENLDMIIPPFDGFIHKNLLHWGAIAPNFGAVKPIFGYFECKIPWARPLANKVKGYCKENSYKCIEMNPVYYYRYSDFLTHQAFRSIHERGNHDKPKLDWHSSDEFCWENYCNNAGVEFLN